ncbi:MAG TPA: AraC family transcriptional regulator [Draconibacterium sp.]|nr:AraC family transcriptional regulator [Draconibacterium sp.]
MIKEIRYYRIPAPLVEEQKLSELTRNLYFTEIGEIQVEKGTIWSSVEKLENNMLVYCAKGSGIVMIREEQIPVSGEQFFVIPVGEEFKYYSVINENSRLLVAQFNGNNSKLLGNEFSVVRNLIPSVNNKVANREMLFDEIFNNLSKGFHDKNLEYVNFCFGHLLATFIYANKTSDDMSDESNPVIRQSIDYMNKNLHLKLTLQQIAYEAGYSATYFTTLFKKETGYSPHSYFSHLKILKATEFLDYTRHKVKEISYSLGYADPYYFTKDFKKRMGLSPRQYRNRVGR